MRRRVAGGVIALIVAGCATVPPPAQEGSVTPVSIDALAAVIVTAAQRSERESDATIRGQLADEANRAAESCIGRAPQSAACLYGQAIALGLEARAHPVQARDLLNRMLVSLAAAEVADPSYDEAGPARVRATVLIRAPGWPLGPGDDEEGLRAAQRAVALRPDYPPNRLVLADAQLKTGDAQAAKQSYARARELAQAFPPSEDREAWLREADAGLKTN